MARSQSPSSTSESPSEVKPRKRVASGRKVKVKKTESVLPEGECSESPTRTHMVNQAFGTCSWCGE